MHRFLVLSACRTGCGVVDSDLVEVGLEGRALISAGTVSMHVFWKSLLRVSGKSSVLYARAELLRPRYPSRIHGCR